MSNHQITHSLNLNINTSTVLFTSCQWFVITSVHNISADFDFLELSRRWAGWEEHLQIVLFVSSGTLCHQAINADRGTSTTHNITC